MVLDVQFPVRCKVVLDQAYLEEPYHTKAQVLTL